MIKKLSNLDLKIIAIITMLIDHIGLMFFPSVYFFRAIGRMAFPLFCFLLTEGFLHTKDVKKYLLRIGLFALISEIPYNFFLSGRAFYPQKQNIFFVLFLGLILIAFIDRLKKNKNIFWGMVVFTSSIICVISEFVKTDYGYMGILIILIFYLLKNHFLLEFLALFLVENYLSAAQVIDIEYIKINLKMFAVFSMIPISLYNGEKGKYNKILQYSFYWFYPIHLILLRIIFIYLNY